MEEGHNNEWKKMDRIMSGRKGTHKWMEERGHNNDWKKRDA